jgi:RHS repeat-associated protein
VRDFVYNNDQQLTAENWMSGSTIVATMAYGYDLAGQLTSASDANSAYAFAYNGDGRVTSVDNAGTPNVPHVVLTGTYDALGDMLTQSATIAGTADFLNNYTYNDDQELTTVTQQGQNGGNAVSPKEIDYAYNAIGQFTDVWDYNTLSGPRINVLHGAFSYDNGARLTGIAYTSNGGATTIDTLGWAYNAGNLVTSFTSSDGTATYGYDPTNQLTSASYTTASGGHQPANESYSFDLNGNRNSAGYTTGSDNLLTSDGTFNYRHDADGNTTVRTRISNSYASDYRTTYTWDYRNRLTDVEYYDNNSVLTKHVHYVYDVFDHLLATELDPNGGGQYTSIQHYVLDVSPEIPVAGEPGTALAQPVLVFDGSQNLIGRNLVAPDPAGVDAVLVQGTVVSTSQGDNDVFAGDDNLGTPRDLVDSTGTLARHDVFTAFGQDIYSSVPALTYWAGFGGGHADAITALVNNYERWYNSVTQTWLTPDPSGFSAGDPNLERYAGNSPTNATDPTGLQPPNNPSNDPAAVARSAADAWYRQNVLVPGLRQAMQLSYLRGPNTMVRPGTAPASNYWQMYAAAQQHRTDWTYQQQHNQYEIGAAIRRAQRDSKIHKAEARRLRWMMNLWGGGGALPGLDTEGTWLEFQREGREPYYGPEK